MGHAIPSTLYNGDDVADVFHGASQPIASNGFSPYRTWFEPGTNSALTVKVPGGL